MAALVPPGADVCLAQRMMHFRAARECTAGYLMWALNSQSTYQQASLDTTGATSPHVNVDTIRNFVVPQLPVDEQERIEEWIERGVRRLDVLEETIRDAIGHLHELRTALISAAVTGKIDVREEVA